MPAKTISGSFTTTGGTNAWVLKKGSASVTIPAEAVPTIIPTEPEPPVIGPVYSQLYYYNGTKLVYVIPYVYNGSKLISGKGVEIVATSA